MFCSVDAAGIVSYKISVAGNVFMVAMHTSFLAEVVSNITSSSTSSGSAGGFVDAVSDTSLSWRVSLHIY